VTGYLLDRDVLSAADAQGGNRNVLTWMGSVPAGDLFISAITVMEARKGLSRMRAAARTVAQANDVLHYEADFTRLMVAYGDRMLVIDRLVADCWGEMLAQREANVMDTAIAATAMVHGLVVATRNVRHFRGRDVRVIDPFKAKPVVMYV
jgi:predicted nucleic acid-binding protein